MVPVAAACVMSLETGYSCSCNHHVEDGTWTMFSCLLHCVTQVMNIETRQAVGANTPGELWVRGPQVMKGYLNDEAATRQVIDEEGWLHTGVLHSPGGIVISRVCLVLVSLFTSSLTSGHWPKVNLSVPDF